MYIIAMEEDNTDGKGGSNEQARGRAMVVVVALAPIKLGKSSS